MWASNKSVLLIGWLLLSSISFAAGAAWRTVGQVNSVGQTGNSLILSTADGARVQVSMLTPDIVRVRMTPHAAFEPDFSYALEPPQRSNVGVVIHDDAASGTITMHGDKP